MEIKSREELRFPPFSRLILVEMSSPEQASLKVLAEKYACYLSSHAPEGTEVLGSVEAPIAVKKGNHRMHILVKTNQMQYVKNLIRHLIDSTPKGKETIFIDVDPFYLM